MTHISEKPAHPDNHKIASAGFTLLELLIAITIFSLLSTACYHLLSSVTQAQNATSDIWDTLYETQKSYRIIQKDIEQMVARPVRMYSGIQQYAMRGPEKTREGETLLTFTRSGYYRHGESNQSELLRVSYSYEDNALVRYTWQTLDSATQQGPVRQTILYDINQITIRFMDEKLQWRPSWPPASEAQKKRLKLLPQAIKIALDHETHGKINWLFSGVEIPPLAKNKKTDTSKKGESSEDDSKDDPDEENEIEDNDGADK